MADQAAGLRRWIESRREPVAVSEPNRTLVVVGLPSIDLHARECVRDVLRDWAGRGRHWIRNPEHWQIVPLETDSDHVELLATRQRRWALWVDRDREGFRRAYAVLKELRRRNGPRRLLVLHPGISSRRGLLNNLQHAARDYLDIELLVLR